MYFYILCINKIVTVSAKILHVSMQILACFSNLKFNSSVSAQKNAIRLCTLMAK